jgi:hypothetical protein
MAKTENIRHLCKGVSEIKMGYRPMICLIKDENLVEEVFSLSLKYFLPNCLFQNPSFVVVVSVVLGKQTQN